MKLCGWQLGLAFALTAAALSSLILAAPVDLQKRSNGEAAVLNPSDVPTAGALGILASFARMIQIETVGIKGMSIDEWLDYYKMFLDKYVSTGDIVGIVRGSPIAVSDLLFW
jgi:hypothetical protein